MTRSGSPVDDEIHRHMARKLRFVSYIEAVTVYFDDARDAVGGRPAAVAP